MLDTLLAHLIVAQATDSVATFPFVQYLNLGVIVVVLTLSYTRKIRFEGEVKEKDKRIEKLEATLEEQQKHYQKEVLPALIEVTRVSGGLFEYLSKKERG